MSEVPEAFYVLNAEGSDVEDALREERKHRRAEAMRRWHEGASPMVYEHECTFDEDGEGTWEAPFGAWAHGPPPGASVDYTHALATAPKRR